MSPSRAPRCGAIDIVDWHPVEVAQAAVDRACEGLQLVADIGIALDTLPRRRRDLCEHDLALIVRILVQEPPKRLELLRQPLGVVEAVDANDAAHRRARLHQAAGALGFGEIRHIDADWEARY